MAEQYNPGLLPRTYFRAPRVPFDFRALALGILGYIVYWAGGNLLSAIFKPSDLGDEVAFDIPGAFLAWALELFGNVPYIGREVQNLVTGALQIDPGSLANYSGWDLALGGVWFLAVWSFFALGIHRITTLRIARDEGMSIGEAIRFSARHWTTLLLCPVIIGAIILVFWGCNALAGLIESMPFVGGVLSIILGPLRLVSTLLIVLVGVGGIFGLPLISAAASWECNGSLDAISRAFSYLFARPLQYFWNYFLIFLFTGLILLVGGWFVTVYSASLDPGNVSNVMTVALDPPPHRITSGPQRGKLHPDNEALSSEAQDMYKALDLDAAGADLSRPPAMRIKTVAQAPWSYKLNVLIYWILLNLVWLGVSGYALYWLIGASSSVYADLRAEVDGTEEDECQDGSDNDSDGWTDGDDPDFIDLNALGANFCDKIGPCGTAAGGASGQLVFRPRWEGAERCSCHA